MVEQLTEAIHIRLWNTYVMIVPSLMTYKWRKVLGKMMDIMLTLPFDEHLWDSKEHFEPLTLAIAFPLLNRAPWRIKCTYLQQG